MDQTAKSLTQLNKKIFKGVEPAFLVDGYGNLEMNDQADKHMSKVEKALLRDEGKIFKDYFRYMGSNIHPKEKKERHVNNIVPRKRAHDLAHAIAPKSKTAKETQQDSHSQSKKATTSLVETGETMAQRHRHVEQRRHYLAKNKHHEKEAVPINQEMEQEIKDAVIEEAIQEEKDLWAPPHKKREKKLEQKVEKKLKKKKKWA